MTKEVALTLTTNQKQAFWGGGVGNVVTLASFGHSTIVATIMQQFRG